MPLQIWIRCCGSTFSMTALKLNCICACTIYACTLVPTEKSNKALYAMLLDATSLCSKLFFIGTGCTLFHLTVKLSLNECTAAALCCHNISGAANNVFHVLQQSIDVCDMLTLNTLCKVSMIQALQINESLGTCFCTSNYELVSGSHVLRCQCCFE